jgi:TonB family protein
LEPVYPGNTRNAAHYGTVVLNVLLDADGQIHNMKVTSSLGPDMDEAAIQAVKRCTPAMKNGQAVDYWQTIEINFRQ